MRIGKHAASVALALVVAGLFSLLPAKALAGAGDAELARALELGIVQTYPSEDEQAQVTYAQFFDMLDVAVELMCPDALATWQSHQLPTQTDGIYVELGNTYSSTDTMRRTDGVMAVFLAAWAMGGKYLTFNGDWGKLLGPWPGPDEWPDGGKFPGVGTIKCAADNVALTPDAEGIFNGNTCAVVYALGQISVYSGQLMFDYDTASKTLLPGEPLTYADAVRAVVRFYDSFLEISPADGWLSTAELRLLQQAESRKQEILCSPDAIVHVEDPNAYLQGVNYTGTAYYISNSGDDSNDGLTPATAFKTLLRVDCREKGNGEFNNGGFLNPGDAVFLERGDEWREVLYCDTGVTYSAYGTGDKPKILGSPMDGAVTGSWSLYSSDDSGKQIWLYSEDIPDCGCVVFNDGESYASRVFSWFDYAASRTAGKDVEVYPYDKMNPFVIEDALSQDLTFYSTFENKFGKAPTGYTAGSNSYWVTNMDSSGPLYLRCDAGNPGEFYDSIEFQSRVVPTDGYTGLVRCAEGCTVDNLCVLYHSTTGIDRNFYNNILIQNCEVGWIGGTEFSLNYKADNGKDIPVVTAGEAVRLEGRNNIIRNSYIHDSFDGAVTMEFDYHDDNGTLKLSNGETLTPADGNGKGTFENMRVLGNVIENSGNGIVIGDHNFLDRANATKICGGITISGNYILGSGQGWSGDADYDTWISLPRDADYAGHAVTLWDGPTCNKGITIKNNVFLASRGSPVRMGTDAGNRPGFSGNTYAQTLGAPFCGTWAPWRGTVFSFPATGYSYAAQLCVEELGDKTAAVLLRPGKPSVMEEDGRLTLQWPDCGGAAEGTLYLALYKGLKMTGLHSETVSVETQSLEYVWEAPPEHDTVRLFMLDVGQSPLYEALTPKSRVDPLA